MQSATGSRRIPTSTPSGRTQALLDPRLPSGQSHLDVLPAIPDADCGDDGILITDTDLRLGSGNSATR
jgi:hypothetical protein